MKNQSYAFILILMSGFLLTCCQSKTPQKPFTIGQGTGINSTTLFVKDLDAAIAYFEDSLGFNIRWGAEAGPLAGTVHTAISFGDMSSLELLSMEDTIPREKVTGFVADYLDAGQGIRLFALSSSNADSTYGSLTARGFSPDSIRSYRSSAKAPEGWSRDDGSDQRRSLDFDQENPPLTLPRFVENIGSDYPTLNKEWNTYYIYRRMFNEHPNGVLGISAIVLAVNDLKHSEGTYAKMGFEIAEKTEQRVRINLFRHQQIQLVNADYSTAAADFLSEKGEGVFALQFDVDNLDSTYAYFQKELPMEALSKETHQLTIQSANTYGLQLIFVQEPAEQKLLVRTLSPDEELDTLAIQHAAALYTKYCALCHGENREGYAADHAPSLKSKSLLATSKYTNFMRYAIQFGRGKSAMAGYLDTQGGPLEYIEIELLLEWLYQTAEVSDGVRLSRDPVLGDIDQGAELYDTHCAVCHGANGEGVSAPALGNPMLLATASYHFLRHAIAEGRDGTPMIGFKNQLDSLELNALTAYLRSRASGWDIPTPDTVSVPTPEEYVLNPDREPPVFELREGMFVSSAQVNKALQDSMRMIILDARSEVAWRQMHIPGAIPVPYYEEPENFIPNLPNDGTQIVIYCACPHAASKRVMSTLNRNGFSNTAIIDEGILVWAQMGFPVRSGS